MSNYCKFKKEEIEKESIPKINNKPDSKSMVKLEDCDCDQYCHSNECNDILNFYKIEGKLISKEFLGDMSSNKSSFISFRYRDGFCLSLEKR